MELSLKASYQVFMARRALQLLAAVVAVALCLAGVEPAHAGFCSATNCTVALTQSNYDGTGSFGTVSLALSGNTVTVDVSLASGFRIVTTGFPGGIGFGDDLGGGLTIGNFKTSGKTTTLYSGSMSDPTNNLHFDGFGYTNDAAATSGPSRSNSLQELSFTVSKGNLITDVRDLLQLFNPAGGEGAAYFAVDSCVWSAGACLSTGLLGVKQVPEPASLVLLGTGLAAIGILRRRQLSRRRRAKMGLAA